MADARCRISTYLWSCPRLQKLVLEARTPPLPSEDTQNLQTARIARPWLELPLQVRDQRSEILAKNSKSLKACEVLLGLGLAKPHAMGDQGRDRLVTL